MAVYNWRVGSGDLGLAADWTNATIGENPASTAPGAADSPSFSGAGGTITGNAAYAGLTIGSASGTAWNFTGNVTTNTAIVTGPTVFLNGAQLVVSRVTAPVSYPLSIGSPSAGAASLTVTGSGSVVDSSQYGAYIGGQAGFTGTLSIYNGGVARFGTVNYSGFSSLSLGQVGTGVINVTGAGSALQLTGGFYAGRASGAVGTIDVSSGATLTQTSSGSANESVSFGSGGTVNGTFVNGGTGSLNVTGAAKATFGSPLSFGTNGDNGSLGVSDANSVLTLGDSLQAGGGSTATGSTGTIVVQNGGQIKMTAAADTFRSYFNLGTAAVTAGTATVRGAGSLIDVGANAAGIGNTGTGTLNVEAGGTFRSATADSRLLSALSAGNNAGSSGTVTVTGAGSSLSALGYTYIGRAGTAKLLVDQGATFTGGQAATGDGTGQNQVFAITIGDGTPSVDVNGNPITTLNFGGSGAAQVLNGSLLHSLGNLDVGRRGTTGTVLVDQASTVTVDNETLVGSTNDLPGASTRGATGTITVQGGSTLKTGATVNGQPGLLIGSFAGNTGTVIVSDAGSKLDANNTRITVGSTGTGTLTVRAGAVATAGAGYSDTEAALQVGSTAGGTGTVTVTGAGSRLTAAGEAVLGGFDNGTGLTAGGTATLSVANGGLFRATALASFGGGTLKVDGTSTAVVGTSAGTAGRLTIDSGASLSGGGTIQASVRDNGTITAAGGTLTITSDVDGTGTLVANNATLNLGSVAGQTLRFIGTSTIRIGGLFGNGTVSGFGGGDVLDFAGGLTPALSGNTITVRSGTIILGTETFTGMAPATSLAITADGTGGQKVTGTNALFDPAYYLAQNPDVKAAGVDPYQHYISSGFKEGRDPNQFFSTSYYLKNNPDVAAAGINPLLHFEANGYAEGRDPSSLFSLADYLAAYPDVKAAGLNPLLHFVTSGRAEGRSAFAVGPTPEPLFDTAYYYAHNPDVRAAGLDAYAHYRSNGFKEGRAPDAYFDAKYYLTQNPDVAAAGVDPLAHFLGSGAKEGREPSLVFSDAKYLAANPDVQAAGLNPMAHYLNSGRAEGRMAFLSGNAAPADPLVNAGYFDPQLGATLIPSGTAAAQQAAALFGTVGWQKGLNPDAFFDTKYYLSHNPDVAAAKINPLTHYEINGWREGRDPSAQFSTAKYLAAYADVKGAGVDPLLHYVASGQGEGRTAFAV